MPIELLWLLPPWALAFVFLGRNEEARLSLLASLRVQDHPDVAIFTRSLHLTLVRNSVRWKGRSIPGRATV